MKAEFAALPRDGNKYCGTLRGWKSHAGFSRKWRCTLLQCCCCCSSIRKNPSAISFKSHFHDKEMSSSCF